MALLFPGFPLNGKNTLYAIRTSSQRQSDQDAASDTASVTEFELRSERESENRREKELTALPSVPDAVITALPSVFPSLQPSHIKPQTREPHLRDGILYSYGTKAKPAWRRSIEGFLTTIYGREPAEPDAALHQVEATPEYPQGWKLILILCSGALPYVVAVIDDTIVATIIPVLLNEFKAPQEIGWYASAYFLPLTIFMPLVGKAYSLWKIKWLFFASLVILLVGSIVCATAPTSPSFIVGRVISGTGAAGIINGAMRIIGVSSSRKARTYLEATGALFMGVCTVSGPILGGVISTHIGWRWAFWINVPIAAASLLVIALIFPSGANQAAQARLPLSKKILRLDPFGSVTLIAFLVCFITLLEHVATSISLNSRDATLAAFSVILFVVFVVHECLIRPDLALIPRELIRHRAVWSCCCSLFMLFAGWMNFVFFLSIFFQTVLGTNAQESAFNLLPYVVAVSIAAAITGVAVSFMRYYNPLFLVGSVCFATGAGLIMTIDENTALHTRIGYEALMGIGVGFLILGNVAPCQTFLDEKDHPVANGLTFFSSLLGATVSLPISNTLFNRTLLNKILALDIPLGVKIVVLLDPTKARTATTPEQLPFVIDALVQSVRKTFMLGLAFSVLCAVGFFFVPWRPLLLDEEEPKVSRRSSVTHLSPPSASFTAENFSTTTTAVSSRNSKRNSKREDFGI